MNFWRGNDWEVKIMYSEAGVATQILISTSDVPISKKVYKRTKNSEVHLSIREATEIGKTAKQFALIHQTS